MVVPDAPGVGNASIAIQVGTRGSAGRTLISFYVMVNSSEELKKPIRIIFGGPIAEAIKNCTGSSDQTQRGLRYSELDADSKSLVTRTLRNDYNQLHPSSGQYTFPGETEILDAFEDVQFTETAFRTVPTTQASDGQEYPYRVMRSECSLDGDSLWENNGGPQFRFRLPQLAIQTPQENTKSTPRVFGLTKSLSVRMALGASYSVARYNLAPTEVKPDTISWKSDGSSSSGDGNVSLTAHDSLRAVLEDSDATRKENAAIYRSGIGLGVGGSLVAWTLPEVYDLAALGVVALLARRKRAQTAPTQTEEAHSDSSAGERESGPDAPEDG